MYRNSIRVLLFTVAVAAAALGAFHRPPASAAPAPTPEFKELPCDGVVYIPEGFDTARLRCGSVTVPETRGSATSRQLEIYAAVLKATSPAPEPDPIMFLPGGPGQDAVLGTLGSAEWYSEALDDRDYVTFDFRGTGYSGKLACEEVDRLTADALINGWTPEEEDAMGAAAVDACIARYASDGVDLSQYSSAIIVEDMVDVMAALGYDEWNLIGGSYGTRLGLTAMRDAGDHIRSAVLDAPAPPVLNIDIERARYFEPKLDQLFAACAAQTECHTAYPDSEATLWDLVAPANATPFVVDATTPDGAVVKVTVDGDDILSGVWSAMSDTSLLPVVPFAIDEISKGHTGILSQLTSDLLFVDYGIATGMFYTVQCNEEWMFYTADEVARITRGVRREIVEAGFTTTKGQSAGSLRDFCAYWNNPTVDPKENASIYSTTPALILAGEFDTNTPTEFGDVTARTLPNSFNISVPSTGHFASYPQRDCTNGLIAAFIASPDHRPNDSCIRAIAPLDFVIGEEAAPAPVETPVTPPAPTPGPSGVITGPDTGTGDATAGGHVTIAGTWMLALLGVLMTMTGVGIRLASPGSGRRH